MGADIVVNSNEKYICWLLIKNTANVGRAWLTYWTLVDSEEQSYVSVSVWLIVL